MLIISIWLFFSWTEWLILALTVCLSHAGVVGTVENNINRGWSTIVKQWTAYGSLCLSIVFTTTIVMIFYRNPLTQAQNNEVKCQLWPISQDLLRKMSKRYQEIICHLFHDSFQNFECLVFNQIYVSFVNFQTLAIFTARSYASAAYAVCICLHHLLPDHRVSDNLRLSGLGFQLPTHSTVLHRNSFVTCSLFLYIWILMCVCLIIFNERLFKVVLEYVGRSVRQWLNVGSCSDIIYYLLVE